MEDRTRNVLSHPTITALLPPWPLIPLERPRRTKGAVNSVDGRFPSRSTFSGTQDPTRKRDPSRANHVANHLLGGIRVKQLLNASRADVLSDVLKRHERSHATSEGGAESISHEPATASERVLPSLPNVDSDRRPTTNGAQIIQNLQFEAGADRSSDWIEPLERSVSLEDFDFGSLDNFLNDVMIDWVQGTNNSQNCYEPAALVPPTAQTSRARTPNTDLERGPLQTQCVVDQQYSNDISRQLKPVLPQFDTIYSAEYLNLCLQMYFTHFHPIFPVVHAPTFRPRTYNKLLLISICSIGSLFIGSPEATAQGHQLYARLNKAILASWETHLSEPKPSTLPTCQAALLGQTFGLLSQKSADRFMTEVFQGTMLAWGRKIDAFRTTEDSTSIIHLTGTALSNAWRTWARAEELRRFALALYIHDTEIAGLFQRDPYLRHQLIAYPTCCADDVFEASTAEDWQRLYLGQNERTHHLPPTKIFEWMTKVDDKHSDDSLSLSISGSSFVAYASLANIGACVMERVRQEVSPSTKTHIHVQGLLKWYEKYSCDAQSITDTHCLRVLWHQYSLLLYSDAALLERALDAHSTTSDVIAAKLWAESSQAMHALLHACLLQKHASELTLGKVPPIHLPRAVSSAGMVFVAFRIFSQQARGNQFAVLESRKTSMLDMPGVAIIAHGEGQQVEQLVSWAGESLTQRLSTLPYNCINLLRKLSHWGVSEVLADSLQASLSRHTETTALNAATAMVS